MLVTIAVRMVFRSAVMVLSFALLIFVMRVFLLIHIRVVIVPCVALAVVTRIVMLLGVGVAVILFVGQLIQDSCKVLDEEKGVAIKNVAHFRSATGAGDGSR